MSKQINLKLSDNLFHAAENYVENHGFRNIQELATESMREKVFEENMFDETLSDREIELIDSVIERSLKKGDIKTEKELMKALK